jgi:hypothetical protein
MRSSPTPELTRREESASCGKFSMTDKLIPLRLNELLGRTIDVMIQLSIPLSWLRSVTLNATIV